jgi:hypothetical protein
MLNHLPESPRTGAGQACFFAVREKRNRSPDVLLTPDWLGLAWRGWRRSQVLPFADIVPWDDFVVRVPASRAAETLLILRKIAQSQLAAMHQSLLKHRDLVLWERIPVALRGLRALCASALSRANGGGSIGALEHCVGAWCKLHEMWLHVLRRRCSCTRWTEHRQPRAVCYCASLRAHRWLTHAIRSFGDPTLCQSVTASCPSARSCTRHRCLRPVSGTA